MKRYMLFAGDNYYPLGGMEDFVDSFDTIEETFNHPRSSNERGWFHIYDLELQEIVKDNYT